MHEREVAPLVDRLLQPGGEACLFALGDTDDFVLGAEGLANLVLRQLFRGLPNSSELFASLAAMHGLGLGLHGVVTATANASH